mmetsp:Transcript_28877/g.63631  ORF Transcript_28877/g.63631 Transcript_28877/m.63631 type:complete len:311 (+) Transcript_28877:981-1913(+)
MPCCMHHCCAAILTGSTAITRVSSTICPVTGDARLPRNQLMMASRSYMKPSAATTGSCMMAHVRGHTSSGGGTAEQGAPLNAAAAHSASLPTQLPCFPPSLGPCAAGVYRGAAAVDGVEGCGRRAACSEAGTGLPLPKKLLAGGRGRWGMPMLPARVPSPPLPVLHAGTEPEATGPLAASEGLSAESAGERRGGRGDATCAVRSAGRKYWGASSSTAVWPSPTAIPIIRGPAAPAAAPAAAPPTSASEGLPGSCRCCWVAAGTARRRSRPAASMSRLTSGAPMPLTRPPSTPGPGPGPVHRHSGSSRSSS